MRVGLLGGSFNPPHEGHLHVARVAQRALGLHRVLWLVSPQNPLKGERAAPLDQRIAETQRLADGPRDSVTGIEAQLGSPYTVHTVAWLKRRYPGVRFFWLMGTDNLVGLHRWRRWRELPGLIETLIVPRPGSTVRGRLAPGGRLLLKSGRSRVMETPLVSASSTALRKHAKGGR